MGRFGVDRLSISAVLAALSPSGASPASGFRVCPERNEPTSVPIDQEEARNLLEFAKLTALESEVALLESTLVTSTERLVNAQLAWEAHRAAIKPLGLLASCGGMPKVRNSSSLACLRTMKRGV